MATNYRIVAVRAAQEAGIPPGIFLAQINQESGFNPTARSPAGALGIAQIMPGTARGWGVNPMDPVASLKAAAKNMARYYRSYGNWGKALAAYNAGPGAVNRYGGIPPYAETQNYVKRILGAAGGNLSVSPPGGDGAAGMPAVSAPVTTVTNDGAQQAAAVLARNASATGSELQKYVNATAVGGKFKGSPLRGLTSQLGQIIPNQIVQTQDPTPNAASAYGAETLPAAGLPGAKGAVPFGAAPDYSWADQLAKKFGLKVTSTLRGPAAQQRIYGGSGKKTQFTSRHLVKGGAVDISGSPAQMAALAKWAMNSGLFAEVFYDPVGQWDNGRFSKKGIGGHSDHVHVSFGAPASSYFYK